MRPLTLRAALVAVITTFSLVAVLMAPSGAQPPPAPDRTFNAEFATPVLGLAAVPGRNQVLVADTGQGILRVTRRSSRLISVMPGVSDIAPLNGNRMFAITGEAPEDEEGLGGAELQGPPPPPQSLEFVWARGNKSRTVVNFLDAEMLYNRDGEQIESNPFGLTLSGRHVLVADAAANTVWRVHGRRGTIRPLATFPSEIVETQWIKDVVGCDGGDVAPDEAELCELPAEMPAEPVPTSVAIGPDGYTYVGELKGFPAGPGRAKVWRIHPDARDVDCATSDLCEIAAEGFTSIVDLDFTSDGRLVVAEFDEFTFLAAEAGQGIGGAVKVCDVTGTGGCDTMADGLQLLSAIAVTRGDRVLAAVFGLVPGAADVVDLGAA